MAMPNTLVLVRHGESEANLVHSYEKKSKRHDRHDEVYKRPDWLQRLSAKGVTQATAAGAWLKSNGMQPETFFQRCYASTFMRARETAYHLGGDAPEWLLDDRIKERDWGHYGKTPKDERIVIFPDTHWNHENNKWYARLDGGESLADNVLMRARDFVGTLHRDMSGKNVLVVSHGEFMLTMRYLIERMLPEEWLIMDEDAAQDIKNCSILIYTRINPDDPNDIRDHLSWMRMVYPYDEQNSPFSGQWISISEKRSVRGNDLGLQLNYSPPLVDRSEKSE